MSSLAFCDLPAPLSPATAPSVEPKAKPVPNCWPSCSAVRSCAAKDNADCMVPALTPSAIASKAVSIALVAPDAAASEANLLTFLGSLSSVAILSRNLI